MGQLSKEIFSDKNYWRSVMSKVFSIYIFVKFVKDKVNFVLIFDVYERWKPIPYSI